MSTTLSILMMCASALIFAACGGSREAAASRPERIVFFGDSITEMGGSPTGYVTLVRDSLAKAFGARTPEVVNAGISGNRVPDLLARLDSDVLAKQPTLVIIYIGINDVWHWALFNRGTLKADYEAGLRELIRRITDSGARVILCTPSVIGEKRDGSNPNDARLNEYADVSRLVARSMNVQLCDLRSAFENYLQAHNPQDVEKGVLTTDGVHLSPAGDRFVAGQMLAAIAASRPAAQTAR